MQQKNKDNNITIELNHGEKKIKATIDQEIIEKMPSIDVVQETFNILKDELLNTTKEDTKK